MNYDNQTLSASMTVNDGDTADNTIINSGGEQDIQSGGSATNTTINSSGYQFVFSGGSASITTVNSGGGQVVYGGATGTTLSGGGQTVFSGGSAASTTIDAGGMQTIYDGGTASVTSILLAGIQNVLQGAVADQTIISGGEQVVEGGRATNTDIKGAVNTGVDSGGQPASYTQAGIQYVDFGGTASSTTIGAGGIQVVSGYVASANSSSIVNSDVDQTTINSGGVQLIDFAGYADRTTVNGGELVIKSGGSASNIVINTGEADVASGATILSGTSGRTITFGDGAGELVDDDPIPDSEDPYQFQASLTAFGAGDSIDLRQFAYTSGSTAVISGSNLDLLDSGGNVIAEFALVSPGATSFTVSSDGAAQDGGPGTLITANAPPAPPAPAPPAPTAPASGPSLSPPANNGTSPPSNNSTTVSVAFNPRISVAPGDVVTLSGTYAGAAGVPSILISEDGSALGLATVNPDGTWSLAVDYTALPGPHTNITATVTDSQGRQASATSPYNLVTDYSHVKPDNYPYRTVQNNYDPATGAYTGSVFFNRNGTEYFESSYQNTADGGSVYTYSGGSYFRKREYSSFSDSYNVQNIDIYNTDGELTSHTEDNNDGTRTVDVYGRGVTLDAAPAATRFVFDPGEGNTTIKNFTTRGANHDTIDIGSVSAKRLAAILNTQPNGNGNLTLHIGHGDVVTLVGVDHLTKHDIAHSA